MPEETPVPATLDALEGLVEEQRFEQASDLIKAANPADAADALQGLDPDDIARVLGGQDSGHTADVLEELPDDIAARTLVHFPVEEAARVVSALISDEEADILQEIPEEQREAIIGSLDEEQQALAREMLSYPEDSAGGLMQKEFVEVPLRARAGEAVAMLQARAEEIANYPAAYLYVTDNDGVLKGILNLRALLFSAPETRVVSIMTKTPVTVSVEMPGEELYDLFRRHRYLALPVVDRHGVLRGVVTKDDAMQFEIESGEEEFLRFSGIAGGEEVRDMPTWLRARQRLIWLVPKMALNVIVGAVIAHFSGVLEAIIALASILPIISDMGGSAGSQAIAVSIRELSLGRVKPNEVAWVFGKELGIGAINGLALGTLLALGTYAWKGDPMLSLVVGGALVVNSILAVTLGGLLPLFLQRLKLDPAGGSAPILTMTTDVCGFSLVLWLAGYLLGHLR